MIQLNSRHIIGCHNKFNVTKVDMSKQKNTKDEMLQQDKNHNIIIITKDKTSQQMNYHNI